MQPVYEFRPFPDFLTREVRRYAQGKWIPDDGAYDLAFIGFQDGAPFSLYVESGHRENIICSWRNGTALNHPGNNPWHYALQKHAGEWGAWVANDDHPNEIAGRAGMEEMSRTAHCCNGRGVRFENDNLYLRAGLIRDRETKKVFTWPPGLKCMYCGQPRPETNDGDIRLAIARHLALRRLGEHAGSLGYASYIAREYCDCIEVIKNLKETNGTNNDQRGPWLAQDFT